MTMKFSAPCIFGLEGLCANELRYLGVENVNAENGRVTFTGDWSTLALANINSRYAERILIRSESRHLPFTGKASEIPI